MKKLVLAAGILLAVSFVFPNGLPISLNTPEKPTPVSPDVEPVTPDDKIVEILSKATREDRARIVGVYSGMAAVTRRDKGARLNTTEKWAEYQANTLQMAVDTPGKYPGLDVAIEAVFAQALGTDDVLAITDVVSAKLAKACDTIVVSAK